LCKLSARNADVDEINKPVVELLDIFEEQIYTSTENCGVLKTVVIMVILMKLYYQNI